jgi:CubicO group peptidase (beta-lactamase class C family)
MMMTTTIPEQVGLSVQRLQRIRPWVQSYIDAGKLPGAQVLVARHGEIAFFDCFGQRDIESQQPVTPDTIFRIYSMSKPITSVAVMMLYEQGRFQLDDPVYAYLPEFAAMTVYTGGDDDAIETEPVQQPMTVRQLLTHTSGLVYGFFSDTPVGRLYNKHKTNFEKFNGSLAEVVARLGKLPLICQPGTVWNYGVSTDVLGRLVEVVSGQTFDRFLQDNIFEPLGMTDTAFYVPQAKRERFAALYARGEKKPLQLMESAAETNYTDAATTFSGGGGLASTMGDYFRFTELLRRKGEVNGVRLLGRKTVEYMTGNHLPGDLAAMGQPTFNETTFEGIGFGLGFSVMLDPAKAQIIGSPGEYAWGGAASTAFWIDPLEDMTVIFMTQLLPSSAYPIRRQLRVLTYQSLIT